ncbi:type II toxin-antitoxin system VapC family toxin [Blastococcus sp. KM273128]|uniref:type II toxin-antitoxin system VapC family toxin n=1 Tax=Blastococcus sp. KM273128 TaxID=2570314 RepID=UPI001F269D1C|nr:type II toxin-antitoxin system VapC family toxin [Blastococcus sp. KM273128]
MIVLDASAAVAALLRDGSARQAAAHEQLHAPHLIDVEVAQTLRRLVADGRLSAPTGQQLLSTWSDMALVRHPVHPLLPRMWTLRKNISAYDAIYVALAEALGCAVLTARTAGAGAGLQLPGHRRRQLTPSWRQPCRPRAGRRLTADVARATMAGPGTDLHRRRGRP